MEGQLGVVDAGPGFGKSTFLRELARAWPHEVLTLGLREPVQRARSRLQDLRGAGLLLVDDADRRPAAERSALASLVGELRSGHRAVLAVRGGCRTLQQLAEELPGPRIYGADLALGAEDIERGLWGVPDRAALAAALCAASGGWPEGVRASLAAWRAGEDLSVRAAPYGAVLVARRAGALDARVRDAFLRARSLPQIREPVLAASGMAEGLVPALHAARVPLTRVPGDAWVLPSPLGRLLAKAPLSEEQARAGADWCLDAGLADEAFVLLWRGGLRRLALALLDGAAGAEAEALLEAWTEPVRLSPRELRQWPGAAERLAQAGERAGHPDRCPVRRAVAGRRGGSGHRPVCAVSADDARGLLQRGHTARARELATAVLSADATPPARATALEVLARSARRSGTAADVAFAGRLLRESLALWRRAEEPTRMAEVRLALAWVDRAGACAGRGVDRAGSVRGLARTGTPLWAQAALVEADLLCDVGRCREADRLLDVLERETSEWAGPRIRSRAAVLHARVALHQERWTDAERWAGEVSGDALGWMDGLCGLRNVAALAEIRARIGDLAGAEAARRLMGSLQYEHDHEVALARAAVESRIGDPLAALAMLRPLQQPGAVTPREEWRVLLLAALAALRAGVGHPASMGSGALQKAVAAGEGFAPFLRERDVVAQVLASAGGVSGEVR